MTDYDRTKHLNAAIPQYVKRPNVQQERPVARWRGEERAHGSTGGRAFGKGGAEHCGCCGHPGPAFAPHRQVTP